MGKLTLIFLLTIMSNACSGDNSDEMNSEVALANNQFSIDMHNKLPSGKNNFISPLCILAAFEMVALGASGSTLSEMDTAFHLSEIKSKSSDPRAVDEVMKNIIEKYETINSNYSLSLANRLFAQENYDIKQKYLDDTKEYYDASVEKVDFGSGTAENIINKWVEDKTNDKITNLFPPGSFSSGTRVTLVSAIYFKGNWASPFNEKSTVDEDFYVTDTNVKKVKMMQKTAKFPYVSDSELKIQMISLPYAGNDLSMIVILPNEGNSIAQVMSKLTAQKLKELMAKFRSTKTNLKFPKFQLTVRYSLNDVLGQLGIKQLFTNRADLSGISDEPLQVSSAVHQAFIDVNEKGTEAAAATGISVVATAVIVEETVNFDVKRPFMFGIVDKRFENSMLFTGVIHSPET